MSYNKTVWYTGDVVHADKLNNIEDGIKKIDEKLEGVEEGALVNKIEGIQFNGSNLTPDTETKKVNILAAPYDLAVPLPTEQDKDKILGYEAPTEDADPVVGWVRKPSDGEDAYGVYVKEYKEGHGGSTDGMLTRPQWLASLKGDKGDNAVNPFKGIYGSDNKPTDTFASGDYIYAPTSASGETGNTIWKWNGTTWQDSGETPDIANAETFASSETLQQVAIDNSHLVNPGNTADSTKPVLAQAEDVMQLKAKLKGISAWETKVSLTQNTNWFDGKYLAYTGQFQNSNGTPPNGVLIINVEGYKKIRFLGYYSQSSSAAGYGFSATLPDTTNTTDIQIEDVHEFDFGAQTNQAKEYIIDIPEDKPYFACTIRKLNNVYMTLDNFYCYLQKGNTVIEQIDEEFNIVDEKIENIDKELSDFSEFTGYETLSDHSYFTFYSGDYPYWQYSGNYDIRCISLEDIDDNTKLYLKTTQTRQSNYPMLIWTNTNEQTFPSSGYKSVQGFIKAECNPRVLYDNVGLTIPEGAKYLYISYHKNYDAPIINAALRKISGIENDIKNLETSVNDISDIVIDNTPLVVDNYLSVQGVGLSTTKSASDTSTSSTNSYIREYTSSRMSEYRAYPVEPGEVYTITYNCNNVGDNTRQAQYLVVYLTCYTDVAEDTINNVSRTNDRFYDAYGHYDGTTYIEPSDNIYIGKKYLVKAYSEQKINQKITIPQNCHTLILNVYNNSTADILRENSSPYNFSEMKQDIEELKVDVSKDELPDYYYADNYITDKIDYINKAIRGEVNVVGSAAVNGTYCDQFAFFTDSHYPSNNYMAQRIIAEISKRCGINTTIFGGDINGVKSSDVESGITIEDAIAKCMDMFNGVVSNLNSHGIDVFCLRGNHDLALSNNGASGTGTNKFVPKKRVYSYLMSKNRKAGAIISSANDACCCYFDRPESKLRYILCDTTDVNSGLVNQNTMLVGRVFSLSQLNAIKDIMLATPSDYNIVLFHHISSEASMSDSTSNYTVTSTYKNTHMSYDYHGGGTHYYNIGIAELAQAVNNRALLQYEEVDEDTNIEIDGTTENFADFSSFSPKVIAEITGHTHRDGVVFNNGVWCVCTRLDSTIHQGHSVPYALFGISNEKDIQNSKGTINENCVDIVVINQNELSFVRIGSGCNRIIHNGILSVSTSGNIDIPTAKYSDTVFSGYDSDLKAYWISEPSANLKEELLSHISIDTTNNRINGVSKGYVTLLGYSSENDTIECWGVHVVGND